VVCVVFAVMAWQHRWISDDGLIVVREIRQILAGNGPNYNPLQRDEVSTSVLWPWLAAPFALLVPADPAAVVVVLGLVMSVGGLALAYAGSARFHRADGADGLLAPFGVLVVVAVAAFWDYGTSGLETGLSFLWVGLAWWLLASVAQGSVAQGSGRRALVCAVVIGLGPLVRPDFGLVTVVFGVGLLLIVRPGPRAGLGYVGAAAVAPVGYEIFRAGYYGLLVPMPALAKEASNVHWARGLSYFTDFYGTYTLVVPQTIIFLVVVAVLLTRRLPGRRVAFLFAAPVLSGLLMCVYVVRVGGDYMHARMLLPAVFIVLLPLMVLPVGRLRRLESCGVLLLVLWAGYAGVAARTSYTGKENGPGSITNEREYEMVDFADARPWTSDSPVRGHVLRADLQRLTAGDGRVLVMAPVEGPATAVPLAPTLPDRDAVFYYNMGITALVAPLDMTVVDANGLATPVAGHLTINKRGRAGHEKWLPPAWALALYADPAATAGMADTREVTKAQVEAARRALSCGELKELADSVDQPMTRSRFWANLTGAVARTNLRVPANPIAAEKRFCGGAAVADGG
jgi:arabinofuranosyltransferase